ncbi:hypothetical protein Patl1_34085 [Pistacia atlantica]|uniref:Uncharacterized protein n=1 Tax=Pistacia atlantica TaxID=434234 RepID=A0ACC0ZW04_9ROSI|nr:hypothetical protein Patl1_34085 [Pistacia atlantica]
MIATKSSLLWLDRSGLQRFCTEHKIILPNVGISVRSHISFSCLLRDSRGTSRSSFHFGPFWRAVCE